MSTGITKLPDKWRFDEETTFKSADESELDGYECADQLEAALPVWTRITEDEATWPEKSEDILLSIGEGFLEAGEWCAQTPDSAQKYIGRYWRPLCDLDYPPEETNDG